MSGSGSSPVGRCAGRPLSLRGGRPGAQAGGQAGGQAGRVIRPPAKVRTPVFLTRTCLVLSRHPVPAPPYPRGDSGAREA
ncbi:hypothetical protein [Parafrankia sp. EUN1f]|uniref:hypothetical protein n=1 Tax=Parafrankia sp. EUN1f TaxID=102897 RepID=UPI0001C45A0A|nr:hypothetical protein [Parafrankia sp. EUN1f]EFC83944.1 hypothetical protein FrEUN1fDRAFT_2900 [Parafrankia sp. EUN1f]